MEVPNFRQAARLIAAEFETAQFRQLFTGVR